MKQYYFSKLKQALLVGSVLASSSSPLFAAHSDVLADRAQAFLVQDALTYAGKVVDEKGLPLADVTLFNGHKSIGKTHVDGTFRITVAKGSVVTFKSLGYRPHEQRVETGNSNVSITMRAAENALDEVVVTALGIKREEKSLGYAVSTVKGEQLTNAVSSNWMDALSGKVAGLNLMRSGAGPVGSTKIILRGENNLTGENQALIVVDGVVINDGSGRRSGNGSDAAYGTGSDNMPADYGSGMDDINPEDIESVSVLKGPGAAALYGQRAANGAVIITTKSGAKKNGKLGITINSNTAFESVNRWPDLQYEYGQGTGGSDYYSYGTTVDGGSTSGTSSAYGPKFDGQYFYQFDPNLQAAGAERTLWRPYKNIGSFFDVGSTYNNTVTIEGGGDKTNARFSATNVSNSWIIPNTGYDRNTVALSVNSKVSDKLNITSKVSYNNRKSDNLPGSGYGNQSLMYWYIFWQPSADVNWLKNYWINGQEGKKMMYPYSTYPENPYAISYEFINRNNRNAFTGNAQATYQFNKNFSAQVRAAIDFSSENRAQLRPYDTGSKLAEGSYRTQEIFSKETNLDFLLRYNKEINDDWQVSLSGGGSTLTNNYRWASLASDGLTFPGVYSHNNNKYGIKSGQRDETFQINSFYGLATAGYKDFLFFDMTGRMDWTSTLASAVVPDKNLGFFYPSFNSSFVLSEVLDLPKAINFAKLRASVAWVGSGVQKPYMTMFAYQVGHGLLPGSAANPTTLVNPNIEPLSTRSIEFGTDIRMFKSRVNLDVAVYQSNTSKQHLERTLDPSSGNQKYLINMGEVRNRGLELTLNTDQIKNKDGFSWSSNLTYTANKNQIMSLPDESIVLQFRSVGSGQIVGHVGGSMGDLYGIGYERAPDGQVVYNAQTGVAELTDEVIYLGNTIPTGKIGLGNNVSYKNFRFNVLFDTQWGAVGHSLTHYKLAEQGKTTNTLPGRYSGIIGNGVVSNGDGTYRKNDVIAKNVDEYYRSHYGQDNAEGSTYPTDFIKLREARLDYTFKNDFTKRLGISKATVGVYGRDLFIWSKWPAFDPEFGTLDGGDIVKGFEIAQFPSTRTIGVNLVVGF